LSGRERPPYADRMRTVLLVAAVFVAAGGGYALGAAAGGDDAPTVKRYVVPGSTDQDPTVDKWVTAECPEGTTVVSGGAVVPHGNDTPGVAVYWSAPYEDHGDQGWWAAAQDTRRGSRRWLLQVQAICLSGIEDGGGGSLPPEVFRPAG
jgi:hypothetical protein